MRRVYRTLPNTRSAAKRLRQSIRRHRRNQAIRSAMRTAIRKCQRAAQKDPAQAEALFREAQKAIDKAARKGVIHPNRAARSKSRLAAYLKRVTAQAAQAGSPPA